MKKNQKKNCDYKNIVSTFEEKMKKALKAGMNSKRNKILLVILLLVLLLVIGWANKLVRQKAVRETMTKHGYHDTGITGDYGNTRTGTDSADTESGRQCVQLPSGTKIMGTKNHMVRLLGHNIYGWGVFWRFWLWTLLHCQYLFIDYAISLYAGAGIRIC